MRAIDIRKGGGRESGVVDVIVLDYDDRHRRRVAMTASGGLAFLLDLAAVPDLRDGDALVLEDGRLVRIEAAAEPLLEIVCADARHLARLAWHLGNRHLPTQIRDGMLLIRKDHVIAEMARGLGAQVREIRAPFDPEKGAYHESAGAHSRHDHGHDH